jgi:GntR family transcriptional regulator
MYALKSADPKTNTPRTREGSRPPLYRRLAELLCERIRKDVAIGTVLPTELQLAEQMQVSRGSVREALQLLSDWGMVERARKVGTKVVRKKPMSGYVQRMTGLGDMLGFAGDTVMRIDDVDDVDGADEPGLIGALSATGYWLQITGARHLPEDRRSSTWTRVFVSGEYAGIRPLLRPEMESIYGTVERVFGLRVSRLRHKVTALGLPSYATGVLHLPEGAPVLQVQAWLSTESGELGLR